MVEILETGEVNPNAEDAMGFSPLMRAAQQDKTKYNDDFYRQIALMIDSTYASRIYCFFWQNY